MRILSAAAVTVVALAAVAPLELSAQATPTEQRCAPSDDAHARSLLAYLKHLANAPTAGTARASLGIPMIDSTEVVAVTDDAVCARAARAMGAAGRGGPGPVYLVRVGAVHWGEMSERRAGEYIVATVMDAGLAKVISRPGR